MYVNNEDVLFAISNLYNKLTVLKARVATLKDENKMRELKMMMQF